MNAEDMAEIPPARLPFPVTRAFAEPVRFSAEGAGKPMLRGQFTTFDDPYEVHSAIEGRFIERMAPGAFSRTVVESRKNIKVLFNHGQDPTMGDQILGTIQDLRADAHYVVDPFDGIPPLIRSGLEAEAYGASHRFSVIADEWDYRPARSDSNPDGVPERLITEARLYEFGPVTFPANPNATASIRSTTDEFYQRSTDAQAYETLLRSAQAARTTAGSPQSDAGLPRSPEPDAQRPPDQPPRDAATEPQDPPEGGSSDSRSTNDVEVLETIDEKRARFDDLNDSLSDQATKYPGVMPDDEQVRFNADVAERDKLGKDLAAWESRQSVLINRAAAAGATQPGEDRGWQKPVDRNIQINRKSEADLHSPETRATSFEGRMAEYRDDAMRLVEKTSFPTNWVDSQRSRDRISDLLDHHDSPDKELARRIKYTSAPAYERAFRSSSPARARWGLTPEEQRGTALAVGVDGTGGFAVPFAFDPTVIAIGVNNGAVNPYRRVCRVVSIVGTDTWNA
jgi:phage head maturation protease